MISTHRTAPYILTIGLILAGGTTVFGQSEPFTTPDRAQEVSPPTDQRVSPERPVQRERLIERTVVQPRVVERRHEGEIYVGGFGGFTWGHEFGDVEGTGSLKGQTAGNMDLANSVVYGAKLGYFHPGRLNWLGMEIEGFNSTPHMKQGLGLPGSHLRVTTLALNLIARTTLGCGRSSDRDRDPGEDASWSALDDHARCPLHVYAGVGPGIFFAETSNQFGRSTDNGRVGLNALAGTRYFMTRNMAVFAEYKFNYAHFDFNQAQGQTAGLQGDYTASQAIGGLSFHF